MVNRSLLNTQSSNSKIHPLAEPAALELGVETFYEVIIYAIILGLPIIELYKSAAESSEKSAKQKIVIKEIEEKFEENKAKNDFHVKQIEALNKLNSLLYKKSTVLEEIILQEKLKEPSTKSKIQQFNEQIAQEMIGFEELLKTNSL